MLLSLGDLTWQCQALSTISRSEERLSAQLNNFLPAWLSPTNTGGSPGKGERICEVVFDQCRSVHDTEISSGKIVKIIAVSADFHMATAARLPISPAPSVPGIFNSYSSNDILSPVFSLPLACRSAVSNVRLGIRISDATLGKACTAYFRFSRSRLRKKLATEI